jgi:integrase
LHDLRYTFVTRAQECGIKREYVSLWAGHKANNSITSNVYTHLGQNKDVQITEMKKIQLSAHQNGLKHKHLNTN